MCTHARARTNTHTHTMGFKKCEPSLFLLPDPWLYITNFVDNYSGQQERKCDLKLLTMKTGQKISQYQKSAEQEEKRGFKRRKTKVPGQSPEPGGMSDGFVLPLKTHYSHCCSLSQSGFPVWSLMLELTKKS